jgi:hypothetical protein
MKKAGWYLKLPNDVFLLGWYSWFEANKVWIATEVKTIVGNPNNLDSWLTAQLDKEYKELVNYLRLDNYERQLDLEQQLSNNPRVRAFCLKITNSEYLKFMLTYRK